MHTPTRMEDGHLVHPRFVRVANPSDLPESIRSLLLNNFTLIRIFSLPTQRILDALSYTALILLFLLESILS